MNDLYPQHATLWHKLPEDNQGHAQWKRIELPHVHWEEELGATSGVSGDQSADTLFVMVPGGSFSDYSKGDRIVLGISVEEAPPKVAHAITKCGLVMINADVDHYEIKGR